MARKSVDAWIRDLREATPKKKLAAVQRLADIDAKRARETLVELLDVTPTTEREERRLLARCLHSVADVEAMRRIVADPDLAVDPELLPTSVLVHLYDDLRNELASLGLRKISARLAQLEILEPGALAHGLMEDEEAWNDALLRCLLAVLTDSRLTPSFRRRRTAPRLRARATSTAI